MNKASITVTHVVEQAIAAGPIVAPKHFLNALRTEATPLKILTAAYNDQKINRAIALDFDFLQVLRNHPDTVGKDEYLSNWIGLIRWAITKAKRWQKNEDENFAQLTAILMTFELCGQEETIWPIVAGRYQPSDSFIEVISKILSSAQPILRHAEMASLPIWEREFFERLKDADENGNWELIADYWQQGRHAQYPNAFIRQSVTCLASLALPKLTQTMDSLTQATTVLHFLSVINRPEKLKIANVCETDRVRFCCTFDSVHWANQLPNEDEDALCNVLLKASSDDAQWSAWMKAFNKYPVRYRGLQPALGRALAAMPSERISTYIETLSLRPVNIGEEDEGFETVNTCLRTFSLHSDNEHRRTLWQQAFEKWNYWRCGENSSENYLGGIKTCCIDFAVVSYIKECMLPDQRDEAISDLQRQIEEVSNDWHESISDCISAWRRLHSLLRPYLLASSDGSSSTKEIPTLSSDRANSRYHALMYFSG